MKLTFRDYLNHPCEVQEDGKWNSLSTGNLLFFHYSYNFHIVFKGNDYISNSYTSPGIT